MKGLILFPLAWARSGTPFLKRILSLLSWVVIAPCLCICAILPFAERVEEPTKTSSAQRNQTLTAIFLLTNSPTPSDTPTDTYTPSDTPTQTLTRLPTNTKPPTATPTASDTPTQTLTPSKTLTPAPSATLTTADLAAKVVRDLHDTDIHDSDLMASTSSIPGRAVILIYLSKFEEGADDAANQAKHDFPILACDLRAAGFTSMIAITGSLDDKERVEGIEISLGEFAIASLDCDNPTRNDVFAIADGVSVHPDLARYFDLDNQATPVIDIGITPVNQTRYIITKSANIRQCASTDCEILATLPYGISFQATGAVVGWYRFTYITGEAWVSADLTSANAPPAATSAPRATFTFAPPVSACACTGDLYNCGDFSTQREAQACYEHCLGITGVDTHNLDGNSNQNGRACESLP